MGNYATSLGLLRPLTDQHLLALNVSSYYYRCMYCTMPSIRLQYINTSEVICTLYIVCTLCTLIRPPQFNKMGMYKQPFTSCQGFVYGLLGKAVDIC